MQHIGWRGGGRDVHKGERRGQGCVQGGEEGAGREKKQDKRTLLVHSK